jgi:hypothetical protein
MTGICKQNAGFPPASGSLTSVSYERVLAKLINALYGDGLKTALLNSEDAMLFPKMETQGWSHWVVVLKSMTLHATRQHRKCVGPKGAAVTDGAVPHPLCVPLWSKAQHVPSDESVGQAVAFIRDGIRKLCGRSFKVQNTSTRQPDVPTRLGKMTV